MDELIHGEWGYKRMGVHDHGWEKVDVDFEHLYNFSPVLPKLLTLILVLMLGLWLGLALEFTQTRC